MTTAKNLRPAQKTQSAALISGINDVPVPLSVPLSPPTQTPAAINAESNTLLFYLQRRACVFVCEREKEGEGRSKREERKVQHLCYICLFAVKLVCFLFVCFCVKPDHRTGGGHVQGDGHRDHKGP